jgi:hypothetical protein
MQILQWNNSTAHRKVEDNKNFIFNNPDYLKYLLEITFNIDDKIHLKAWF